MYNKRYSLNFHLYYLLGTSLFLLLRGVFNIVILHYRDKDCMHLHESVLQVQDTHRFVLQNILCRRQGISNCIS